MASLDSLPSKAYSYKRRRYRVPNRECMCILTCIWYHTIFSTGPMMKSFGVRLKILSHSTHPKYEYIIFNIWGFVWSNQLSTFSY